MDGWGGGFSWAERAGEESGPGGRELSWLLDAGARWAICTIRAKIRSATENSKTKQAREKGIKMPEIQQIPNRFPLEEEQLHFHRHLTTIRPETPRVLRPDRTTPDQTGVDVERGTRSRPFACPAPLRSAPPRPVGQPRSRVEATLYLCVGCAPHNSSVSHSRS